MENQIVVNQSSMQTRNIDVVTNEIIAIKTQAQNTLIAYFIEIGKRLTEAKSMLGHGEWSTWLEEKVEFSHSSANNYMKLYEEYGEQSPFLLGIGANSQPFANLSYAKAIKLLSLPKEEREEFVEKNDIENKSVRETNELIKEHKKALEEKARLEEENERLKNIKKDAENAQALAFKAESSLAERERELDKIKKLLKEKEQELDDATTPSLSDEELDAIKKDAKAEAKKELDEKLAKEKEKLAKERAKLEQDVEAAKAEKAAADALVKDAEAKALEFEKQIRMSSPLVTKFKTIFDDIQAKANNLLSIIEDVEKTDQETAQKLRKALSTLASKLV